jgi:hypothetical protein
MQSMQRNEECFPRRAHIEFLPPGGKTNHFSSQALLGINVAGGPGVGGRVVLFVSDGHFLKELNTIPHVWRIEDLPNLHEAANHLSNGPGLLVTIRDSRMLDPSGMQAKKILVVGHNYSCLRQSECNVE